jgi:hypothetical protein
MQGIKMKRVILLIVFFILCILTFNHCKKCKTKQLETLLYSTTDLKINPYNGTEKLHYIDSIGDSIIYYPNGRKDSLVRGSSRNEDRDCPPEYWRYSEANDTKFTGDNLHEYIEVKFQFFSYMSEPEVIRKGIEIDVCYQDSQFWYFTGSFEFDNLNLSNINTTYSEVAAFNDSIFIGPTKHYNVFTLIQNKTQSANQNLKTVFYNISEGIVGFKTDTGLLWYLKE